MYEPIYPHHGEPYQTAMKEAIAEFTLWEASRIGKPLSVGYTKLSVEEYE